MTLLLAGLMIQLVVFPFLGHARRRRITAGWSRELLGSCGVEVRRIAQAGAVELVEASGCMFVANHVSWLDIFVVNSVAPARFVAKAEIRRWPLIGRLVHDAGTIFIERGRRHAVHGVIGKLVGALRAGQPVMVFPEGTTNDGRSLHRFHANLIEASVEAGAPLVPLVFRYLDRAERLSEAVEFVGDTSFMASLWRIIGAPVTVAELMTLDSIEPREQQTRHDLARLVEAAIADALGVARPSAPRALSSNE